MTSNIRQPLNGVSELGGLSLTLKANPCILTLRLYLAAIVWVNAPPVRMVVSVVVSVIAHASLNVNILI